jgi:hypothetical protein
MSDYRPTEQALRNRFPKFAGLGGPSGPLAMTARHMMNQAYDAGRDIVAARRGFEKHFNDVLDNGNDWALKAREAAGGLPWDPVCYQHALASSQTFHRMGQGLPPHLKEAVRLLRGAYPALTDDMLEGVVLAFRNIGLEDITTADAKIRLAGDFVFWMRMEIGWVSEAYRTVSGIPWTDAAYEAAQKDPNRPYQD